MVGKIVITPAGDSGKDSTDSDVETGQVSSSNDLAACKFTTFFFTSLISKIFLSFAPTDKLWRKKIGCGRSLSKISAHRLSQLSSLSSSICELFSLSILSSSTLSFLSSSMCELFSSVKLF